MKNAKYQLKSSLKNNIQRKVTKYAWIYKSTKSKRLCFALFLPIKWFLTQWNDLIPNETHPLSFLDLMDSFSQERSWVLKGQSLSLIVTPYPLGAFFRSLRSSYFHSISVNKLEYEKRYWPVILARVGRTGPQILSYVVSNIISPCNHIQCFFCLIRFLISVF